VSRSERTAAWYVLAALLIPPVRFLQRQEVRGVENIPAEGAFVLSPNHMTNLDPVTMGLALWDVGRPPHFLAKESLFRVPVLGALMRATRQVPVTRGQRRGPDPVAAAREIARLGGSVIVYPEGSLTRDPASWPMRGKTGAVRIALEAGIPLIPAVHWGDQEILPRYGGRLRVLPPRRRVQVRFGTPLDLSPWRDGPVDQAALTAATACLMAAITALLEEVRGETAPVERWDPTAHGQSETGRIESP
jgi:1-acyl-sn-glycerol-3-phosphate acyltransferase